MTHPSVNSIVERLDDARREQKSLSTYARLCREAATIISELQAENERLQCALMFWMPGVDLRLDEATREQCANDAGLLAGYSGPLAGRRWGNEIIDTVAGLQAERVDKAAAWDALAEKNAKIAALESSLSRIKEETIEECAKICERPVYLQHPLKAVGVTTSVTPASLPHASAIRSLGSTGGAEKTAESGHSPSTPTTATE